MAPTTAGLDAVAAATGHTSQQDVEGPTSAAGRRSLTARAKSAVKGAGKYASEVLGVLSQDLDNDPTAQNWDSEASSERKKETEKPLQAKRLSKSAGKYASEVFDVLCQDWDSEATTQDWDSEASSERKKETEKPLQAKRYAKEVAKDVLDVVNQDWDDDPCFAAANPTSTKAPTTTGSTSQQDMEGPTSAAGRRSLTARAKSAMKAAGAVSQRSASGLKTYAKKAGSLAKEVANNVLDVMSQDWDDDPCFGPVPPKEQEKQLVEPLRSTSSTKHGR